MGLNDVSDKRIIFDIETRSTEANAAVMSIGMTYTDYPNGNNTVDELLSRSLHLRLDWRQQIICGRHEDPDTLEWWERQSFAAKQALLPKMDEGRGVTVNGAAKAMRDWMYTNKVQRAKWWCRGPSFDAAILQDLFGTWCPFNFWDVRDFRTHYELLLPDYRLVEQELLEKHDGKLIKHVAHHDCVLEALMMQKSLEKVVLREAPTCAHAALAGDPFAQQELAEKMAW